MKIRPVILCGGEGTRLWPKSKNNEAKQFINFGGWNLFQKTLLRVKGKIFDHPIISTNIKYLKQVKFFLKKSKIKKYNIVLEPAKKNTAPAILSATLIKKIPDRQGLMFFPADHLLENNNQLKKSIIKNKKYLNNQNIFIFGIKPTMPSKEYGYFLTKKTKKNINKISKFIEKPSEAKAKKIIKKKGYWNSGMFFARKDSIINNFKKHQPKIYKNCLKSVLKAKFKQNIYKLNKTSFLTVTSKSFDYAILEKTKNINGIMLNLSWTDLGNWKEILKTYHKNKSKYFDNKNVYHRPWGRYVNLFEGKNFLVKELTINSRSSISLQKHNHRSEHWMITQGKPRITMNKKKFFKKKNDFIFIPVGTTHRIENLYKKPVKIMEAQTGPILKETDIIRYKDVYGRVK
jgi:mannose-1-phosphate guanylyltransferase/mannose-6-phosphate isomerase